MININQFRESLCNVGRSLFDSLPAISSSYGQFSSNVDQKFETESEEIAYKEHISKCQICSNAIKN